MPESGPPVIIVGAGLAGLTCARELHRAGVPVRVIEVEDTVGGRVRSWRDESGFIIDRGFQIMLSAYPAVARQVDLDRLGSAAFDAGAVIWTGSRRIPLADPLRHPASLIRDLTAPVFGMADKLRLARWALETSRADWDSSADAANEQGIDRSGMAMLRDRGFSTGFIRRFAQPFWGGILLDRSLSASAGVLEFTLQMFLRGSAVLPEGGVGAVPAAIAADLPRDAFRLNACVTELIHEGGRVTGVRLANGETMDGSAVVVAADPPTAHQLTGIGAIPTAPVGCVTVYLTGGTDPGIGKKLMLDGTGRSAVNHIAPLSSVQPSYAPAGRHLIAAVMLEEAELEAPDTTIAERARADTERMLGQLGAWNVHRIVRVPFSLYHQEPGLHRRLPDATTGVPGLFLASDATSDASSNGAVLSGETAARAVRSAMPLFRFRS
ncbi:MAG TPA: NAD(P)/FAD-dependent oxidoreductase [Thermomicrobiales bacterium]|nr:NAD(P)/FAD-dependent oxidoreductase [Thermomicrobiales bacterium]